MRSFTNESPNLSADHRAKLAQPRQAAQKAVTVPNITIPKTIEAAVADLNGLGALITAKEWHRAAIVWAFTVETKGGRRAANAEPELSCTEFAKLGISGLSHKDTVSGYRKRWQEAVSSGQVPPVQPGDSVQLPTTTWVTPDPDRVHRTDTASSALADPERVAAAVAANPQVAAAVLKAAPVQAEIAKAERRAAKQAEADEEFEQEFVGSTDKFKASQRETDQAVPPVGSDLVVILSEQLDPAIRRLLQAAEKYPAQLQGLAGEAFAELLQERIAKLANLVPVTVPNDASGL